MRFALEAEVEGNFAGLEALQAHGGVHVLAVDFLGMRLSYFLDVHAALGGVNDDVFAQRAVQQHTHVVLLRLRSAGVVHVLSNQDFMHFAAFRAGLLGDELHAEDVAGNFFHLLQVFGEFHSAPFAPTTRVNLRLDNVPAGTGIGGELLGGGHGLLGRVGHDAFLHAHAVFFQDFLALIFVNVHKNGKGVG